MRGWPLVLLLLTTLGNGIAFAQSSSAAKALHDLFAADGDYDIEHSPEWASDLGDRRWNDRWSDESVESYAHRNLHSQEVLAKLAKIDRGGLAAADQLNYDLFKKRYEDSIEGYKFHGFLVRLNQRQGIQTTDELADALRFETLKDYQDWITRMRTFPALMDQDIALMRQGIKERIVHPKVIMERIPAQLDKQIVSDPTQSGFYRPFLHFSHFSKGISAADQQRLRQEARQAVEQQIVPAFKKFKDFFVSEYLPACFDQVGIWQMPNGAERYAFEVRHFTTTNATPEEVHEIGLREVARIRGEMDRIIQQTRFKGTREEFFKFLRTDPQFFYKTPDDLFEAYKALAKTVDPNLVKVFRTLPREPYGVEAIPAVAAPDTTAAYYRPGAAHGSRAGTHLLNLYKPETRPKWEMTALTLHESVPVHHLQIARAHELGEQPHSPRFL